jgi:hypothetical protein
MVETDDKNSSDGSDYVHVAVEPPQSGIPLFKVKSWLDISYKLYGKPAKGLINSRLTHQTFLSSPSGRIITITSTSSYEVDMHKSTLLVLGFCVASTVLARAGDGNWKALQAQYLIHSKTASYPEAPTMSDRVVTVAVDGSAAKDLFDLIGPDLPTTCSGEKGDRGRSRKGVQCTFTAQDAGSKEGPYRCWIGLNLRTGNGDVRVSC